MNLLRTKDGKKLYPVGNWYKYQHVFYNYYDICAVDYYEAQRNNSPDVDKKYEKFELAGELINKWDFGPQKNGMVFAEYKDYAIMKDVIGGYMWRHGGYV